MHPSRFSLLINLLKNVVGLHLLPRLGIESVVLNIVAMQAACMPFVYPLLTLQLRLVASAIPSH